MNEKSRGYLAVALWVLGFALMLYGTTDDALAGYAWGAFTALAASCVTMWALSTRRDHMRERTVENIAEVVDALHTARRDSRHLR